MRKLYDWKALKAMGMPYSRQHLARLEKDGLFPRRIQLGQCRVAWSAEAVDRWIDERLNGQRPTD